MVQRELFIVLLSKIREGLVEEFIVEIGDRAAYRVRCHEPAGIESAADICVA